MCSKQRVREHSGNNLLAKSGVNEKCKPRDTSKWRSIWDQTQLVIFIYRVNNSSTLVTGVYFHDEV